MSEVKDLRLLDISELTDSEIRGRLALSLDQKINLERQIEEIVAMRTALFKELMERAKNG